MNSFDTHDWMTEIPTDWTCQRLKNVLIERNENNNPVKTNQILSLTNDRGVILYNEKGDHGNKSKDDVSGYKLAYPGDIVLNSMNVVIGSVNLSNYFGCVSPVYYMLNLRNKEESIEYYNYLFQTSELQNKLKGYGNGILEIRMRIPMSKLNTIMLPIPPKNEQKAIVKKISEIDGKISKLIKNQKEQIEVLKDYKQSVITKTVLGGLNNSPKKDTRVSWIGSVPSDWKIIRIKNACRLKGRIGWQGLTTNDYTDEGPYLITGTDFDNGIVNWKTCVHITEKRFAEDEDIHILENDLLITKDGTIGKTAIAKNCPEKVSLNSGVLLVRNTKDVKYNSEYLRYMVISDVFWKWFNSSQTGNSTIKHLYQEQFYYFAFPLPPDKEQKEIVKYLNNFCELVDDLIDRKEKKIEKLSAYGKSLIYEYVTGKKRV